MTYIETIMSGLMDDFDEVKSACTYEEKFAYEYLISDLFKKLPPTDDTTYADNAALQKFLTINDRCKANRVPYGDYATMHFLEIAKGLLSHYCDDNDLFIEEIAAGVDLGAGSNVLSHSSCSYSLKVGAGVSGNPRQLRLVRVCEKFQKGRLGLGRSDSLATSSLLSYVPKNNEISRVIMTEPTAAMLLQRGLSKRIEVILGRFGISMKSQQDTNRALAQFGSQTGKYATIDLQSASDCISNSDNGVAKYLTPPKLWAWIQATRTASTKLPSGEIIPLEMVCGMGNGFCSTYQTLIFCAIVRACCEGKIGVFGDDMIFEDRYFSRVVSVLRNSGFLINESKSFSSITDRDGHVFRESCGGDYLNGVNVRPVQCKLLKDVSHRVILHNRLYLWQKERKLPIPRTLLAVRKKIDLPSIPDTFSETMGPFGHYVPRYVKGKVKDTHGDGYKIQDLYKLVILIPSVKRASFKGERFWSGQYVEDLISLTDEQIFVMFLRGDLRDDIISFRSVDVTWVKKVVTIPSLATSNYIP